MSTRQFICLACGHRYSVSSCACTSGEKKDDKHCPECNSINILEFNPANLFGFSGGGG